MNEILSIIKESGLSYEQKIIALARAAEDTLDVFNLSDDIAKLRDEGIICDLYEGNAPYRPRYIVPDYERFLKQGSEFLRLDPPQNLNQLLNNLLILYKHVPSITSKPVYIGNIDYLIEPFITDEEKDFELIKNFMLHIDRTITDSFCHANLGPKRTKAGELILRAEQELDNSIPNITLKYDDETDDEFALLAIETALKVAKPSFANNKIFSKDFGGDYGIVSCYNGLDIGGGSLTLVRMNLGKLAYSSKNKEDFFDNTLPHAVKNMIEYMDKRVNFLMEESNFFESSFLSKEGLITADKFTAMFGMVALAECTNDLLEKDGKSIRFGKDTEADEFGEEILNKLQVEVNKYSNKYLKASDGKYLLHAQVGIDTDIGFSPGCRIPIGEEPEIHEHLIKSARFHKYFPTGIGDIFRFDKTAKTNPSFIKDIIKGAFSEGLRYFSLYSDECDVVRITGYLVKLSDIEKLNRHEVVLNDAVVLGKGAVDNQKVLERRRRK